MFLLFVYLFGALGISFLCSILEASLMSTPISYITMKEEEGSSVATLFKKHKTNIDRPIAAILSLNTIANTFGASAVGVQSTAVFGSAWFGVVSACMTVAVLIFSEIIPKTIGTSHWRSLMGFTARTVSVLIVIMYPFVIMVRVFTRLFQRDNKDATISREEVSAMANVAEEEGVFDKSENEMIQKLLSLAGDTARDAMTPRVVCAVADETMTAGDFYKDPQFLHHSRIPVYSGSPETMTGYILRSDVLQLLVEDKFNEPLSGIRRKIKSFNEDTILSEIWDDFLKHREQISLVFDEYNCFLGILTFEDVLETILGSEIVDEKDEVSDLQQYARERLNSRKGN